MNVVQCQSISISCQMRLLVSVGVSIIDSLPYKTCVEFLGLCVVCAMRYAIAKLLNPDDLRSFQGF